MLVAIIRLVTEILAMQTGYADDVDDDADYLLMSAVMIAITHIRYTYF